MEHIVAQFTLIDFLGIFSPGAVFVLACNFYVMDLTAFCTAFFGDNQVMLIVYFVVISYLSGNILHQFSAIVEKAITNEVNVYAQFTWQRQLISMAYKEEFERDFPSNEAGQIEAGKDIFRYVQGSTRPQRIVLFNAFYTMSRVSLVLLPLLFIMTLFFEPDRGRMCFLLFAYGGAEVVFYSRRKTFDRKCIQEAYMLFISKYISHKHKANS